MLHGKAVRNRAMRVSWKEEAKGRDFLERKRLDESTIGGKC